MTSVEICNRVPFASMSLHRLFCAALLFAFATSCAHWEYGVPDLYEEKRLLPLSGDQHSVARAINDASPAQIVGYSENDTGLRRAVVWTMHSSQSAASPRGLSESGTEHSEEALDVNAAGNIVGFRLSASGQSRALLWKRGKLVNLHQKMLAAPKFEKYRAVSSQATTIDDRGRVGGGFRDADGKERAFIFEAGRFKVIEVSGAKAQITALNGPANLMVGASFEKGGWSAQSFRVDLTRANPEFEFIDVAGLVYSHAHDVNQHGHIVGANRTGVSAEENAYLSVSGRFRDLGVLRGAVSSAAYGVNSRTKVVGTSKLRDGVERAFIWAPAFQMFDLNRHVASNPDRVLNRAYDINDQEIIVGYGKYGEQQQGFALIPGPSRYIPIKCTVTGPAKAANGDVINYSVRCANGSGLNFSALTIESEIPKGTEVISIEQGGGQQAPNKKFPQGRIKWRLEELSVGKAQSVSFAVRVIEDVKSVYLSNFSASSGSAEAVAQNAAFTQIEKHTQSSGMQFMTPNTCESLSEGSSVDFELGIHDFEASRVDLVLGEESIASDTQSPWVFSLNSLPAGVHCFKAVATSTSGKVAGFASRCIMVGLAEANRPVYSVVELGARGGVSSEARAIDENGDVVGWAQDDKGKVHAALWFLRDENGKIQNSIRPSLISTAGVCEAESSARSVASDITSNGRIVGSCGPIWKQNSFLWQGGRIQKITIGDQSNLVSGISSKGLVVGRVGGGSGSSHAFSWRAAAAGETEAQVNYLYGISDTPAANAHDINDHGLIVGESIDLQPRAVLWVNGVAQALTESGRTSRAFALSNGPNPIIVG